MTTLAPGPFHKHNILVVDSDRRQLKVLERVFKAAVGSVDTVEQLDVIPSDGAYDLIALSYDTMSPETRRKLFASLANADSVGKTRLLLFSAGAWEIDHHRELFGGRLLTNLLAKNGEEVETDDLLVTVTKILSQDIFGMQKYFTWGAGVVHLSTCRSDEKDAIAQHAHEFAKNLGVNERLCRSFAVVTDELLTNAIYNAPVDEHGRHIHAARSRGELVELPRNHAVDVKFCSDGRKIGVSIADPYGSLTTDSVLDYLAKCFRKDSAQIDTKAGGAGLGLFQAFGSVSHLVINIQPGRRCEAIGMIDVRGSFKDFVKQAKSFNIFIKDDNRDVSVR